MTLLVFNGKITLADLKKIARVAGMRLESHKRERGERSRKYMEIGQSALK